ncbi:hypothetical protein EHQ13_16315 [Leptospira gomenensis]|uniref:Uncharacterized protein n=1 Tax=Leptospira gomenensis TaxID=2484974 RepID=A0A5F1YFZ6_9LEPT|nr:hypothetical protein [Leptospira gomenensis]TGK38468.1 hypothetical protein EHQ17_02190 [Leptospira gomenensis]TGK38470.1 hypothetical protein EHQ17_02200 [Leptospira gomenensis]TGK42583.1 hypothetical protein EHQ07_14285 [Leptospira gomenensis]TGK42585.1 hypothetical protein EHQ07_14295 [Leptospira gomenensis]TGK55831.1 hypothetical protein EHQ13_16305 [Leptospira gomenensis]
MIKLRVSGFSEKFSHLNNKVDLKFSYLSFLRCYVTASYSKKEQGLLRYIELGAQALNYLHLKEDYLKYTERYETLEKSDKDNISYRTGEALLKIYSEQELKIETIIKLKKNANLQISKNKSLNHTIKPNVGITTKKAREPDFIGIDTNGLYHVLETKCRSQYSTSEHQHAINQVNTIDKINSKTPETKTACLFVIGNKSEGNIIDPDSSGLFNITIESSNILKSIYYPFYNFDSSNSIEIEYDNRSFLIRPFIFPSFYIGIERTVLTNSLTGNYSTKYRNWVNETNPVRELLFNNYVSIGNDGIIVLKIEEALESGIRIIGYPRRYNFPFHWLFW